MRIGIRYMWELCRASSHRSSSWQRNFCFIWILIQQITKKIQLTFVLISNLIHCLYLSWSEQHVWFFDTDSSTRTFGGRFYRKAFYIFDFSNYRRRQNKLENKRRQNKWQKGTAEKLARRVVTVNNSTW